MIVPRQPPPNLLAPYPAIKALNHPGIIYNFLYQSKNYASLSRALRHLLLLFMRKKNPCELKHKAFGVGNLIL